MKHILNTVSRALGESMVLILSGHLHGDMDAISRKGFYLWNILFSYLIG